MAGRPRDGTGATRRGWRGGRALQAQAARRRVAHSNAERSESEEGDTREGGTNEAQINNNICSLPSTHLYTSPSRPFPQPPPSRRMCASRLLMRAAARAARDRTTLPLPQHAAMHAPVALLRPWTPAAAVLPCVHSSAPFVRRPFSSSPTPPWPAAPTQTPLVPSVPASPESDPPSSVGGSLQLKRAPPFDSYKLVAKLRESGLTESQSSS